MLSLVGEWHFASTTVFIRGMTPCLCHHFLPSGVLAVLLLPEPLSITRMVDHIPLPLESPDLQAQSATDCGVRGIFGGELVLFRNLYCICCFKVWRFCYCGWNSGAGHLNIWADGIPDSIATAALVICGCGCHRGSGARVMCAAYLDATGFSKAVGSVVMVRGTRL